MVVDTSVRAGNPRRGREDVNSDRHCQLAGPRIVNHTVNTGQAERHGSEVEGARGKGRGGLRGGVNLLLVGHAG